jgi:starch synthase (maltosyl-transferring)
MGMASPTATTVLAATAVTPKPSGILLPPSPIIIQRRRPIVDDGTYPVKRIVGDIVDLRAEIFRDGHDLLAAAVRYRPLARAPRPQTAPDTDGDAARAWRETPLQRLDAIWDGVLWGGSFTVDEPGRWEYVFVAWNDRFGTWLDELTRKRQGGQDDLDSELLEGRELLRETLAETTDPADRAALADAAAQLGSARPLAAKVAAVSDPALVDAMGRRQARDGLVQTPPLALLVERERARFSTWYELFPRSWGGLKGVREQLPKLAELGFDVVYLTPIHPIGHTNRKGRDNSVTAGPDDPGSPWSIGDEHGGHDAIHPQLGNEQDLRDLTAAARELGIEIALDFAVNCSADHPWLHEHPEWFHHRPDGTLKYAENPPKRYQDIYNVNWETPAWRELWQALLDVVLHWHDCGVRVFRVDNPHTKPWPFWHWLIDEVHRRDPDVIFLAEAFTRKPMMLQLAKIGFTQSYTYFTWKNSRWELTDYLGEVAGSEQSDYLRPNFFVNTPDILHAYLQHGGRPAFEARLVLAATLSPSYGIYSGFENVEDVPLRPGSEEYLHSEKYEIKQRQLDGELLPLIRTLNAARRESPALRQLTNLTFLETENEQLIAYAKQAGRDAVVTVVSLDPHSEQQGVAVIPKGLGLPAGFKARDILTGERFDWHTGRNYVAFRPGVRQAHVLRVEAQ